MGFGREERRYKFDAYRSEIESTDVKFLYDVNSETRKLIKRSSREGDLKETFKAREMSSISTLEFALEHKSLWRRSWDETYFCWNVAQTNKLELLKWAREEKKCEWDEGTIIAAASQGNLEMVKYCVANECPIDEWACACAARNGHLEVLKYLREEVKAPWDSDTASWAAANGHLHILEYLVERKYDQLTKYACWLAAENGHLDCLKYLHETAKAPWNSGRHTLRAREQPPRLCTIPSRQRLSSPIWLAIRRWRVTRTRIRIGIRILIRILIRITLVLVVRDIGIFRLPHHKASHFPHFISTPLSR